MYYLVQPGPGLPDRFAYLIGGLCHALGAVFTRDRSRAALTLAVHARLCRLATRFAALVARIEAGHRRDGSRSPGPEPEPARGRDG